MGKIAIKHIINKIMTKELTGSIIDPVSSLVWRLLELVY